MTDTSTRRNTIETTDDGEMVVRYWSVYAQSWRTSVPGGIPDAELAAMDQEERDEILATKRMD